MTTNTPKTSEESQRFEEKPQHEQEGFKVAWDAQASFYTPIIDALNKNLDKLTADLTALRAKCEEWEKRAEDFISVVKSVNYYSALDLLKVEKAIAAYRATSDTVSADKDAKSK